MKNVIAHFSDKAPKAVGPYCHMTLTEGNLAFISGQLPLNPLTMKIEGNTAREQAQVSLSNLKHVLDSKNLMIENIAKTTIFLVDINDFADVNIVYADFFEGHKPARSCFAVKELPMGAKVEIEAIAVY